METLCKFQSRQQPLGLSLHHHSPSFSRPISSVSFKIPPPSRTFKFPSIRCSSDNNLSQKAQNPKPHFFQTLNPFSFSFVKTTCITIAAAALLFVRLSPKPVHEIASAAPPNVESTTESAAENEQKEKSIEEYLKSNPEDVETLRALMECKVKSRKLQEAISILDRMIQIDPNELEWPLLKANLYSYSGESEMARAAFEQILEKHPLCVEAYHGLIMAVSQSESGDELKGVMTRIEAAIDRCKKEKKTKDLRDFKLLVAQVRVIEGSYTDALKVYQELAKEEPRDFRPYLCQGIIYTLLRKKDEAEKQFEKYRRLVPKEHPYAQFFDDNMFATKMFSQKAENDRVGASS